MGNDSQRLSRRDFLKLGALSLGALAFRPWVKWADDLSAWQGADKFGRVCEGRVDIRVRPYVNSAVAKTIYDDALVVWLREVVGENPGYGSSRWVETPDGYIYLPRLQPTYNHPNQPLTQLPNTAIGKGMWAEVTLPYVDVNIINPPVRSHGFTIPRLYYGMVVWVDDIKTADDGRVYYRVNEKYGYSDLFWAAAEAFRPITAEEVAPISPDVKDKRIVVNSNINQQWLSCYEEGREVFYCQVSTGTMFDMNGERVDKWATPLGKHPIYRKLISLHMSGETTGDYPAVAWTSLITGEGVAVHSAYWHNAFGMPRTHGCINVRPEDAKWIFRWTYPHVSIYPGEIDVSEQFPPVGTVVEVIE